MKIFIIVIYFWRLRGGKMMKCQWLVAQSKERKKNGKIFQVEGCSKVS